MVSTVVICGWRVSTVTMGLTTPAEALPRASFAEILNVTSPSMTGTVQTSEPEFAYEFAIMFQIPAPVAYWTVMPEAWSTQEMASVIFAGFQERVFALALFQNSPTEGEIHTSEAIVGPTESFTMIAPVEDSLLTLYALSIHLTFKRYWLPSGSPEGMENPVYVQFAYPLRVPTKSEVSPTWSKSVPHQYFPSERRLTETRTEDTPLRASVAVPTRLTLQENAAPLETFAVTTGGKRSAP